MATQNDTPLISVVIVNYKVPDEICQLLRSLRQAELYDKTEVIIVDNASKDNSHEIISKEFPDTTWIPLKSNIGFGKACNVGTQNSRGNYLLFLNPDTLVSQNTLRVSVDFLESHPDVGIMGPKIIKPDGSFQPHCRRSFPTPFNAFTYLFGLSKLFPKSKLFGQYNLSYLNPDASMEVDAISGSFIFMRHSLFKDIGGFDKAFFMYGEDLDICVRCREHGYKAWYNPDTQIIHFSGKSCTKNMIRSRIAFYESMVIFSKKYRHSYGAFFPGWVLIIGAIFLAGMNIGGILLKSFRAIFIDLLVVNIIIWAVTSIRFYFLPAVSPYFGDNTLLMLGMHIIMSLCFLLIYSYQGVYSSKRYSAGNTLISGLIASILFLTGVFFIKSMAFSRVAFAISAILIPLILVAWRELLPRSLSRLKQWIYSTGKVMIIGSGPIASALIKDTELDKTAQICGIIWPSNSDTMPGEFEGYPVLGDMKNLSSVLKRQKADLLLIATNESWYSSVIEALTFVHLKHLKIRWVPLSLFENSPDKITDPIPLNDFSI